MASITQMSHVKKGRILYLHSVGWSSMFIGFDGYLPGNQWYLYIRSLSGVLLYDHKPYTVQCFNNGKHGSTNNAKRRLASKLANKYQQSAASAGNHSKVSCSQFGKKTSTATKAKKRHCIHRYIYIYRYIHIINIYNHIHIPCMFVGIYV